MGGSYTWGSEFGVRVEKTVYPSGDPYPMVAYVVEHEWPGPIAIRFTDSIPDDVRPADVGFRDSEHDDWTVGDDGTIAYETTIDEDAAARTVVFIREEPFPADAVKRLEPEITAVQRVDTDGPSAGVGDGDRPPAGVGDDDPDESGLDGPADGRATGSHDADAADGDVDEGDTVTAGAGPPPQDGLTQVPDGGSDGSNASDGQPEEIKLEQPGGPDDSGTDATQDHASPDGGSAGRATGGEADSRPGSSDESADEHWKARTVRIEVNADDIQVADADTQASDDGDASIEPDQLSRLERRLADIQGALAAREATHGARGHGTNPDRSTDDELVDLLEAFTDSAERLAGTLDEIHEYVADTPEGTDVRPPHRSTPRGPGDADSALPGRSQSRPDGREGGRRQSGSGGADRPSNWNPPVLGSGHADRPREDEHGSDWAVIDPEDDEDEARVVVFDATNGRDQPDGTPPDEANRVDQSVDVRDFAMDDDEFTFDELIALGSDILSSIAESASTGRR